MKSTSTTKQDKTLNRALLIMTTLFALFTAAVFVVFWHTGSEPVELVKAWMVCCAMEIVACVRIKLGKQRDKYHDKYEDGEDSGRGSEI